MPTWMIHSQNPVGAQNIKRAMEQAERYAGGYSRADRAEELVGSRANKKGQKMTKLEEFLELQEHLPWQFWAEFMVVCVLVVILTYLTDPSEAKHRLIRRDKDS